MSHYMEILKYKYLKIVLEYFSPLTSLFYHTSGENLYHYSHFKHTNSIACYQIAFIKMAAACLLL